MNFIRLIIGYLILDASGSRHQKAIGEGWKFFSSLVWLEAILLATRGRGIAADDYFEILGSGLNVTNKKLYISNIFRIAQDFQIRFFLLLSNSAHLDAKASEFWSTDAIF